MPERLRQQLAFLAEVDRLKTVLRRNTLIDGSRRENSAEHSWHISLMALVLAEYANEPIDVFRVVQMLLIHDVVEIDAGDTFTYDPAANADKAEREQAAADRLFALLPPDQAASFRALWDEFEAAETPEAKFAQALDRLQPVFLNYLCNGGTWTEFQVPLERIVQRNGHIKKGSTVLWDCAKRMIHSIMGGEEEPSVTAPDQITAPDRPEPRSE